MARGRARGRRRRSKEDAAKAIEEEDEAIVEEHQPLSTDDDDDDDYGSDQSLDRCSRLPLSPPPSALRSPPPRTTNSTSNNNNNKIYMLLSFQKSNPVSQALYAVDASPPPILQPHSSGGGELTQSSEKIIYPVFEFMKHDGFPDCMSCVVLGSSIYFVGGDYEGELPVGFPITFFSEKVYRIDDVASIPLTPTDPRSVLQEVAPMSSGKPMCYCFVALGLLFAIGVQDCRPPRTVFEVYDPLLDKWTPLPDPPFPNFVVSDAVVGNMVILKTAGGRYYSFDAASLQWENLAQRRGSTATCYMGASGRGVFLDDTIYWDHYYNVISSGPSSRVDPGGNVKDLMSILYTSASAPKINK